MKKKLIDFHPLRMNAIILICSLTTSYDMCHITSCDVWLSWDVIRRCLDSSGGTLVNGISFPIRWGNSHTSSPSIMWRCNKKSESQGKLLTQPWSLTSRFENCENNFYFSETTDSGMLLLPQWTKAKEEHIPGSSDSTETNTDGRINMVDQEHPWILLKHKKKKQGNTFFFFQK